MLTRNRLVKNGWPRNSAPDSPGAHALMLGKQVSTQSNCTTFFFFKFTNTKLGTGQGPSLAGISSHMREFGENQGPTAPDPPGWTPLCQNRSPLVKIHGRRSTKLRG